MLVFNLLFLIKRYASIKSFNFIDIQMEEPIKFGLVLFSQLQLNAVTNRRAILQELKKSDKITYMLLKIACLYIK